MKRCIVPAWFALACCGGSAAQRGAPAPSAVVPVAPLTTSLRVEPLPPDAPDGAPLGARILRIDPRHGSARHAPILTTVIELARHRSISDLLHKCASLPGDAELDCVADQVDQPDALYTSVPFPRRSAMLTVAVGARDLPASVQEVSRWGDSKREAGVGTAWLIAIDAASSMGARLDDAREVAKAFVVSLDRNDIVRLVVFNDRAAVRHLSWTRDGDAAMSFIESVHATYPQASRTRPLREILRRIAGDGFFELGDLGRDPSVPLHQAMVVLSNGVTGAAAEPPEQSGLALAHYLTRGRFPEDDSPLQKMPVPAVSIWFPVTQTEELFRGSRAFMQALANVEIGGHLGIVRAGQASRGARIVQSVRRRFDDMLLVRWRVPCLASTQEQTFTLFFSSPPEPIEGDRFVDAIVGVDPTVWLHDGNGCGP